MCPFHYCTQKCTQKMPSPSAVSVACAIALLASAPALTSTSATSLRADDGFLADAPPPPPPAAMNIRQNAPSAGSAKKPTVQKVLWRFNDYGTMGCADASRCFISRAASSLFTFNSSAATATAQAPLRQVSLPTSGKGEKPEEYIGRWYTNTIAFTDDGGSSKQMVSSANAAANGAMLSYVNFKNGLMHYVLFGLSGESTTQLTYPSLPPISELGREPFRTPTAVTAKGNVVIATFGANVTLVSTDGGASYRNVDIINTARISPALPLEEVEVELKANVKTDKNEEFKKSKFSYLLGAVGVAPAVAIVSSNVWYMRVWDNAVVPPPPLPYKWYNQHIMKTTDGGKTFDVVFSLNVTDHRAQSNHAILSLTCVDALTCFVAVRRAEISLLATRDGGKTWTNSGAAAAAASADGGASAIPYPLRGLQSKGNVVAFVGGSYTLYFSFDAGATWQAAVNPVGAGFGGLSDLTILPNGEGLMFACREKPESRDQFSVFKLTP